jgi:hypothetical protein
MRKLVCLFFKKRYCKSHGIVEVINSELTVIKLKELSKFPKFGFL